MLLIVIIGSKKKCFQKNIAAKLKPASGLVKQNQKNTFKLNYVKWTMKYNQMKSNKIKNQPMNEQTTNMASYGTFTLYRMVNIIPVSHILLLFNSSKGLCRQNVRKNWSYCTWNHVIGNYYYYYWSIYCWKLKKAISIKKQIKVNYKGYQWRILNLKWRENSWQFSQFYS